MSKVLIVDDDRALQHLLKVKLQQFSDAFEIVIASDGEEAINLLNREKFHLLVTDIKMPRMDGLSLLARVSLEFPALPCIVLTSYTIPGIEQKLSESVLRFHKKPVNPEELGKSIILGLEQAAKHGALGGVSLTGLIQIIEVEQKTCVVVVSRQAKEIGRLFFLEGELTHAVYREVSGEQAAIELIGLENIQSEYLSGLPDPVPERSINSGLQGLILEAMRLKDEQAELESEDTGQFERKLLERGINLCEGLHFTMAQNPLRILLQKNGTDIDGWLWISRCLGSKKKTKVILRKLYKLAPSDPRVAAEIRKFHLAAPHCGERIFHCPFCYAPLDPKAIECSHCHAFINFTENARDRFGKRVKRPELEKALKRFESVLSRELNVPVLFYAGMAHLNLDNIDEALQYFEQVQECRGTTEDIYTRTVQRILAYIASRHQPPEQENEPVPDDSEPTLPESELPSAGKILVVEDSPTTRKVIKMTLEANDYRVVEAGDGMEALTKLNDERPNLVLLDVMLPTLDGYGILSLLKKNEQFKKIPVIMLTSKDRFRDKIKGRFSAASAYLTKPFEPKVLLREVAKHLPSS